MTDLEEQRSDSKELLAEHLLSRIVARLRALRLRASRSRGS
jgi:hypothetical protein